MKILILKETNKPYSKRTFKPGDNIIVTMQYGRELIAKKKAVEIPHQINGVWHVGERPSKMLSAFWNQPVTIEQYEKKLKKEK